MKELAKHGKISVFVVAFQNTEIHIGEIIKGTGDKMHKTRVKCVMAGQEQPTVK